MTASSDLESELDEHFEPSAFADSAVTVVVPDRTRPIDYGEHVAPLLDRLVDAGAAPTVLAGIGLHRPMSEAEIAPLRRATDRLQVPLRQHDASADDLVELDPDVSQGRPGWPELPAEFHPAVAGADAIVTVGTVEPHQYAGFSGGAKGVGIGCASHRTIGAMHGLEFLRREGTRLGAVEGNPFHAATWRLVEPLPPIFGLQVIPASGPAPQRYAVGSIDEAYSRAIETARTRFFTTLDTPQEWLHLPVSEGKATNFYQASRAATYAALVERPALADGATIVVDAPCPEGIGTGAGERACARALSRGVSALLEELRGDEPVATEGGAQRAYVIAKTLDHYDLALVGAPAIDVLDAVGIPQFSDFEAALRELRFEGPGRTVEDIFHSVPRLAS